jgi:valyl-tRNA synthetase
LAAVVAEARKIKSEKQLSMRDEISELIIKCPSKMRKLFQETEKDLRACTNAQRIIYRS